MTTVWDSVTWAIASAGGFTAYILLTLSVIEGLALSLKFQSARWPRIINSEMHNFLSLLGLIFLVVHVLAVWIDPFTKFGLSAILVPFVSTYRPLGMALGIVSLYLGIAIAFSTWIRPKIGYKWWRRFHVLTLVIFVFATLHGIIAGSNSSSLWAMALYGISSMIVLVLTAQHFRKPAPKQHNRPAVPANNRPATVRPTMERPREMVQARSK